MLNRRDFMSGAATGLGAMALMSPELLAQAAQDGATSLNVIYPNHEGAKFDLAYYRATHIPLAMKVMKAKSVMLIQGMPTGNAPVAYVMIAHFQFASPEALQAALKDPGMAEVRADVAKATDIKPTVVLGKVL